MAALELRMALAPALDLSTRFAGGPPRLGMRFGGGVAMRGAFGGDVAFSMAFPEVAETPATTAPALLLQTDGAFLLQTGGRMLLEATHV
jgi:hypothetical protein